MILKIHDFFNVTGEVSEAAEGDVTAGGGPLNRIAVPGTLRNIGASVNRSVRL